MRNDEQALKHKVRRQTFGGTSTRVSTKSEKDEKSKRRYKSSSGNRRKAVEGISSRAHNTSKKPSESIKDYDMDVVEKYPQVQDSSKQWTTTKHPSHFTTDLVGISKNYQSSQTSESATFTDLLPIKERKSSASELNSKDSSKERKLSKQRPRSTSELNPKDNSKERKSSKQRPRYL
jgi:hypothetical protein